MCTGGVLSGCSWRWGGILSGPQGQTSTDAWTLTVPSLIKSLFHIFQAKLKQKQQQNKNPEISKVSSHTHLGYGALTRATFLSCFLWLFNRPGLAAVTLLSASLSQLSVKHRDQLSDGFPAPHRGEMLQLSPLPWLSLWLKSRGDIYSCTK